jgi:phage/plasmid-associated DNA primase
LILQTNSEPLIDGTDNAMVLRCRLINFPNIFVDNPVLPNHRKIDRSIKSKIKNSDDYKIGFFHILLDHYREFAESNDQTLLMPKRISDDTKKYLDMNDPVKQFIDEMVEITKNKNDYVMSSNLYNKFIDYNEGVQKGVNVTRFKQIMIQKGHIPRRTKHGVIYEFIKLLNEEEDDDLLF